MKKESVRPAKPEAEDSSPGPVTGLNRGGDLLPGKWLVHCPDGSPDRRELLELLLELSRVPGLRESAAEPVEIELRGRGSELSLVVKSSGKCFFYTPGGGGLTELPPALRPEPSPRRFPLQPTERVSLVFPSLPSDPRWRSIGLPTAHLFLGSSLAAAGFKVYSRVITLPSVLPPEKVKSGEFLGLTLFADLFMESRAYLEGIELEPGALLAVGGPLVSNSFLPSVLNLPAVQLFIRGEAEFALPKVLKALANGDYRSLFAVPGLFLHLPPWLVLSDSDLISRPPDFSSWPIDLSSFSAGQLATGLETALSRGCRRSCVFCSQVSGRRLRQLPAKKFGALLDAYLEQASSLGLQASIKRTVNINDDDLLQDPGYAARILEEMKQRGFSSWGVQTSPASLLGSQDGLKLDLLDLVSSPEYFVSGRPLLWLGTDVFLPERARRLGKPLIPEQLFHRLLAALEERGVRHCHYWISSDAHTDWLEFCREFVFICKLVEQYPRFRLLAHAPFIIPYPETVLFRQLAGRPGPGKIVFRKKEDRRVGLWPLNLVAGLETDWPELNFLLHNRPLEPRPGFIDLLAKSDFKAAGLAAYDFLRREVLSLPAGDSRQTGLKAAQEKLESYLES